MQGVYGIESENGPGKRFDKQLGRLGFLEASNVRVSGKLGLILEGFAQWGKFAAQSAFYPYFNLPVGQLANVARKRVLGSLKITV